MSGDSSEVLKRQMKNKINSPEELTDYLKITNTGVWIVFVSVIILLIGIFVWFATGTLETTADAKVIVENHAARVVVLGDYSLEAGETVRIPSAEFVIASVGNDEFGRQVGQAIAEVPDGNYDGLVVIGRTRSIDFLINSR